MKTLTIKKVDVISVANFAAVLAAALALVNVLVNWLVAMVNYAQLNSLFPNAVDWNTGVGLVAIILVPALAAVVGWVGSSTFDVRGVKIGGKTLASTTGMNLGEARKGGFTERKKEVIEKRTKRAKELQVGENDPLKQALNKTEADLQKLLSENAQEIEALDKTIEKKREEVNVANSKLNAAKGTAGEGAARAALTVANDDLDFAKKSKKEFHQGVDYMVTDSTGQTQIKKGTGVNIEALETQKKAQIQSIKTKNVEINREYAATSQKGGVRALNFILSGGAYTEAAAKEAAHNIIMETKLDSGAKH